MNDKVDTTDRINEILTEYDGNEVGVLLNDIDGWETAHVQELLTILDEEIHARIESALDAE